MTRRRFLGQSVGGLLIASQILPQEQKARASPLAKPAHDGLGQLPATPTLQHPPVPQLEPRLPRIENIWYEEPVLVGLRKQLLVDDYLIAHRFNIHRELNRATKANGGKPLLVHDKPWEDPNYIQVRSVFREGDKFRMWYWGRDGFTAYAESGDGLTWIKPNLRLHEFQGGKDNNLTDLCEACYLDPHETDPAHRYKAAFGRPKPPYVGISLAHSPDGYRWTFYNNGEAVTYRAADTLNQIIWDEEAQLYRLFTRTDFGTGGGDTEYRGAREMVNPDVKANPTNWTTVQSWKFDREGPMEVRRRQVHTLNLWIHESIHFGLLSVYDWPAGAMAMVEDYARRQERDVWNFCISTRRPRSMEWDHRWVYEEKQLIPRGEEGSFDKDLIHASSTIITWKDQHWIYYSGFPIGHFRSPAKPVPTAGALGLAMLPLDRFIHLEPWMKEESGWFITKPFKLEGRQLEVNADARRGWLAVEVLDAMGEPMAGFTRKESKRLEAVDGLRLQVPWGTPAALTSLKDKTVRLKFHLKDAKLWAFQVKS